MEEIGAIVFWGCGALYWNFLFGQYYVFLLLLLTFSFWLMQRSGQASSGFMCGITFALKLYGGPFLLYFAAKRRWRAVAGMIAAVLCAAVLAIAIFGVKDVTWWATQVFPRTLEGGSVDPYNAENATLSTLLRRLFVPEPELNPAPLWNAPGLFFFLRTLVALSIVVFTVLGLAAERDAPERRGFAWFMIAVILLSTSTATYTFVLLLLPLFLLLEDAGRRESVFLIGCCFLLAIRLQPFALFPKLWLLAALFILAGREFLRALPAKTVTWAACCIVLVAIADAAVHLRNYRTEPGQQYTPVAVERGAFLAGFPVVSSSGLFYEFMGRDRYVLHWLHDGRIEELAFQGHALRPFAPAADGPIFFELVTHGQSTMMQFDPLTRRASPAPPDVHVAGGEAVMSPDQKWQAFTSDRNGTRRIWLRNLSTGEAAPLTGGKCNSWSPAWALDSSALIFSSDCGRAWGLPALYRANLHELLYAANHR